MRQHGHVLTPGRYVGAAPQEDDGDAVRGEDDAPRRRSGASERVEAERLDAEIEANLEDARIWLGMQGAVHSTGTPETASPPGWREWYHSAITLSLTKGLSYKSTFLNEDGPDLIGLGQFVPGGGAKLEGGRTYAGEYRERDVARPGDILIAMTDLTQRGAVLGSPLMVPRSVGDFCLYTLDAGKLDPDASVDARFLYYMLKSRDFRAFAAAHATGTTVRRVRPVDVLAYEFVLPPLEEQRAIARVLGALDDRIELNRRMSETLEEMARALFRSWFVDFDPVRAKAEGRPSGLPPDLDALFPASFEESELGEIPAGWEVRALGDVIDVNPKRTIKRGDVATHVEMAALPISGPHVAAWTQRAFTSGSRFTLGDTLLARITPSLENGKTAFVDFLHPGETGWGSTEFIVLRPKAPWPAELAYVMAREPKFREHAIVNMTGTSGRQRVPAEAVSAYNVAAPPDRVAASFGKLVHPWFERSTHLNRQSRALAEQRDALLPRLVSGELRVGTA